MDFKDHFHESVMGFKCQLVEITKISFLVTIVFDNLTAIFQRYNFIPFNTIQKIELKLCDNIFLNLRYLSIYIQIIVVISHFPQQYFTSGS